MVVGSIAELIWISCCVVPILQDSAYKKHLPPLTSMYIYSAMVVSSILNGIGNALMWVSQAKYFADCATKDTKGFYFSIFWTSVSTSQIFGYLISSRIILYFDSIVELFMVMMVLALFAVLFFFNLQEPEQKKDYFKDY